MNPKVKKWLIRGSLAAMLLVGTVALTGYLTRGYWARHLRMYMLGQLEVRAEETGRELPGVDQVEVIALGDRNPTDKDFTFMPARVSRFMPAGRKTLDLPASQEVARIWRQLHRRDRAYALCHNPGYALRFLTGGKLLLETTVCWECMNYSIPLQLPGFKDEGFISFVDDEDSKSLLRLLKSHVPLAVKTSAAVKPVEP